MSYLDLAGFKALSLMPDEDIDALEARYPGFVAAQLADRSGWIESRLRKRYAVPFALPYPDTVKGWLASIVTVRAYLKRGVDPTDEQWLEVKKQADDALAEIKEAADGELGLFDLPLRADTTATGISKGGPYVYSEQSPYVWTDQQADVGRSEDGARGGSHG